jgi:hypothetical protein
MLDRQLFVEGWKLGAKWGLGENGNRGLGNSRSGQSASSTSSGFEGGNSMPPQVTQQASKHDL